jgi:two-component system sensor histidine kinase/response regulator
MAADAVSPDYAVEVFHDAAAMLEALGAGRVPELLILDWHMPGISGLEACAFVRQTRDVGSLPILVLTASSEANDVVEALDAGANDFVVKPFRKGELQARVAALLRNRMLHIQLAEAEQRLRVEGEFREGFIGMLAHDLRQPLSTLLLANQTLAASPEAPAARLLQMQRRAAERMSRMGTELLDLARSRPETGMPVDRRPLDLGVFAAALLEEIKAANPTHAFVLDAEGACEGSWDHDRVAQLCTNLLGNAVEHGAKGAPVVLRLRRSPGAVVLSVSNEGEPIPAEIMASIFEPFRRGRGVRNQNGGMGLGLHIVSAITRAHGGIIEVRSDARVTVFEVTLPIA